MNLAHQIGQCVINFPTDKATLIPLEVEKYFTAREI